MFAAPRDDIALFNEHFMAAARTSPGHAADYLVSFIKERQAGEPGRAASVTFSTVVERLTRTAFETACLHTQSHEIGDVRRATQALFREFHLTENEKQALVLAAQQLGIPFAKPH